MLYQSRPIKEKPTVPDWYFVGTPQQTQGAKQFFDGVRFHGPLSLDKTAFWLEPMQSKTTDMKRKAVIDFVAGSKKEYYFILRGDNGEIIGDSETYKNKQDAIDVLKKYHPDFRIVDLTKKK